VLGSLCLVAENEERRTTNEELFCAWFVVRRAWFSVSNEELRTRNEEPFCARFEVIGARSEVRVSRIRLQDPSYGSRSKSRINQVLRR